ncbi:MAG: Rne/Rng family ribonuclease [Acidobacteria bacterium]|nr:Rne/Rng family ribonuclease [Acidobacteriota bacterium]
MKQEILVTRDRWQISVAVLEDGHLVEYFQEPSHLQGLVGNIYVGKVSRVLPGMASAFVDVGLDRDGFLFEGDMGPLNDLDEEELGVTNEKAASVKDLHQGQPLLVQVSKEPLGSKGARLTTQISIPGHYLIFMPNTDHVGVSRKIGGAERSRLKSGVKKIKGDGPGGFIVRTAAENVAEEDLAAEMQGLAELWALVKLRSAKADPPALVHQEADLISRAVREILLKGSGVVVSEDPEIAGRCRALLESLGQDSQRVSVWNDRDVSLFERYRVEQELERALQPRVWLPSGGCIVLQSTEALVAIDVNSGRFLGKKSLEDTAFLTNMEAVDEIVRQIRLRGLGGIIVIDFIDMTKRAHRDALVAKLQEALKADRSRSRILNISEFGLVEMTRKRTHKNLERVMTSTCPCCEGRGRVAAPWRVAQNILAAAANLPQPLKAIVKAAPDVVRYVEENRETLAVPAGLTMEPSEIFKPGKFEIRKI